MRDCTICVAKTRALISFAVICAFVFAFAKIRFYFHDAAHILIWHIYNYEAYFEDIRFVTESNNEVVIELTISRAIKFKSSLN